MRVEKQLFINHSCFHFFISYLFVMGSCVVPFYTSSVVVAVQPNDTAN
jgi:hypothetical protein